MPVQDIVMCVGKNTIKHVLTKLIHVCKLEIMFFSVYLFTVCSHLFGSLLLFCFCCSLDGLEANRVQSLVLIVYRLLVHRLIGIFPHNEIHEMAQHFTGMKQEKHRKKSRKKNIKPPQVS